jgi:hypothetical protein
VGTSTQLPRTHNSGMQYSTSAVLRSAAKNVAMSLLLPGGVVE